MQPKQYTLYNIGVNFLGGNFIMKKLIKLGLSCFALLAMTACGGNGGSKYDETVLDFAADSGLSMHAVGGWGEWAPNAGNKMTATSVAEVGKLNEALADKLAEKPVQYLFMMDITLTDASWGADNDPWALKGGEKLQFKGGQTVKALRASYDAEGDVYDNDMWIPDPHKAHAESLTEDTLFIPTWQEAADEQGFEWSQNPVCIGEIGTYHFIVAQYSVASTADVAGYGLAMLAA